MDGDERDEYVFVDYSADFLPGTDDAYVWVIEVDVAADVAERPTGIPNQLALAQNYPNPFNPTTNIRYTLPERTHATLKVYTTLGEEVATLVDEVQEAGNRTVSFDARGLASGVYLYRLSAAGMVETKSMILIK